MIKEVLALASERRVGALAGLLSGEGGLHVAVEHGSLQWQLYLYQGTGCAVAVGASCLRAACVEVALRHAKGFHCEFLRLQAEGCEEE